LYGLGWNYHFEGVYEWAAEQFELAKRGNNDDLAHKAAYYEGVNLALAVQSRQAAKVFEELIAMWPRGELTGHAWIEMGMARYALRQWQGAADAFEG